MHMIYTCTVNPSLDYYLKVEKEIEIGEVNRSINEFYTAGGKGVNVSIVLNNLMIPSTAIGFLGGFVKDYYLSFLKGYPFIQPIFTGINGNTRINIKINGKKETDLNTNGPHITDEEFERFLKRALKADEGDIFILSGNVQSEIYSRIIAMIEELSRRNVKIILDTNPVLIRDCLKYKPLLIKPNLDELEELVEKTIHSEEEIYESAKKLVEAGAKNVILSLGSDGAILADQSGIYKSQAVAGHVVSTTGCGDAMVGAYVFNIQRGANAMEAFKYASAAGSATAFVDGLATRNEIETWYKEIEVERIQ